MERLSRINLLISMLKHARYRDVGGSYVPIFR